LTERIKVAAISDVLPGQLREAQAGENYLVLANVDGSIYALNDECTHQDCALSDGQLEGDLLICPCHGGAFDVRTGAAKRLPAVAPVTTYPVVVEGDDILVEA
jgi:nitrite reductase/ring-hydroxylating ferredoxin subunit